jgi:hypothetical protein
VSERRVVLHVLHRDRQLCYIHVLHVLHGQRQLGKGHLNIVKPRELILTR